MQEKLKVSSDKSRFLIIMIWLMLALQKIKVTLLITSSSVLPQTINALLSHTLTTLILHKTITFYSALDAKKVIFYTELKSMEMYSHNGDVLNLLIFQKIILRALDSKMSQPNIHVMNTLNSIAIQALLIPP